MSEFYRDYNYLNYQTKDVLSCKRLEELVLGNKYISNMDKDSQEYKLLKYRYELLLKSGDKINDEKYFFDRTLGYTTSEAGVLECVLSINKELKMA